MKYELIDNIRNNPFDTMEVGSLHQILKFLIYSYDAIQVQNSFSKQ